MKYLLVISKNYWGANKSEETADKFLNIFSNYLEIQKENIHTLLNSDVNVFSVKKKLYDFINLNYSNNSDDDCKFYIYINGHGNQINDNNNDENISIIPEESIKDNLDEIYQLPDGNIVDDDITNILKSAIKDSKYKKCKPFILLISDHCSSGSMIDNIKNEEDNVFNWISIGSSLDNQDSLMTGDGNVMTINFLNLLSKLKNINALKNITAIEFNELLQKEMKESFVGDLQTSTFHLSDNEMLLYKLFE